eukprot:2714245-Pleurochrysis_carterae.AAC.1
MECVRQIALSARTDAGEMFAVIARPSREAAPWVCRYPPRLACHRAQADNGCDHENAPRTGAR